MIPRDYLRSPSIPEGIVGRFCERVADYKARVERVPAAHVPAAVAAALNAMGANRVAVAAGLPDAWRTALTAAGVDVVIHLGRDRDGRRRWRSRAAAESRAWEFPGRPS